MRTVSIVVLLIALLGLFASTCSSSSSSSSDLADPVEFFPSSKGNTKVNLTVRAHRISIDLEDARGKRGSQFFEYTGRFYFVDGSDTPLLPGPTLHVVPGGKIKLQLRNELGAESSKSMEKAMNTFHHPNTTNIHFHGMHSDPTIDDPFTTIVSNESLYYKLPIPRDHLPGLHWYHAHSHGSVYMQVMGGLFGPIVVGDASFMSTPKKDSLSHLKEHVLMIHLYRLRPSAICDGTAMAPLDELMETEMPSMPQIVSRSSKKNTTVLPEDEMPADLFLVNGQHRPTVKLTAQVPSVLLMAFASGSCHLNLTFPPECAVHAVAYDGVPLARTEYMAKHWVYFTTATRVEAAVVCQGQDKTYPVALAEDPKEVVFYLRTEKGKGSADGKQQQDALTFPVTLPKYTPDYLYLHGQKVRHSISFSQRDLPTPKPYYVVGQGSDCSSLQNDSTCFYEHFQGKLGSSPEPYRSFVVPLYSVVTATIYGDPTDPVPHPLHFHVNHFQYLSFVPRPGGQHANHTMEMYGVRPKQFRDTIPILDGVTTIRWQAASYPGEVVYHCHALHHEDRGMMASYLVLSHVNGGVSSLTGRGGGGGSKGGGSSASSGPVWRNAFLFFLGCLLFLIAALWLARHCCNCTQGLWERLVRLRTNIAGQPVAETMHEGQPLVANGGAAV